MLKYFLDLTAMQAQGGNISAGMQNYWLDPIATMNKGLQRYDADADVRLKYAPPLSKLPHCHIPEPVIRQVKMSQADGPFAFQAPNGRQRASCTRPQLDIMPDRISTSFHHPDSSSAFIEPFPRQGQNARWLAKDTPSRRC